MRFVKGTALVLGFAGAVGLGVWLSPHIPHRGASIANQTASFEGATANADNDRTSQAVKPVPAPRHATARPRSTEAKNGPRTLGTTPRAISVIAPALHDRLKPLLHKGADMTRVSDDFGDAEQLAAVVHAARNTDIPFMVLKQRIVYDGRSLEDAIHESRPALNAAAEAKLARTQAKADISALNG